MNRSILNLGLVGLGRWGRNYVATLGALPGLRLARVADADPSARAAAGAGCATAADWRELIAAGDVDGLVVATPPASHVEIAGAAVDAGLPVLVEKPLALSGAAARDLLTRAERRGGFVMVDHIHLFQPAYRHLKRLAGAMGAIRHVRGRGGRWGPFRPDAPVLWDWGPHDVALALDLFGERPTRIAARPLERRTVPEGAGEILAIELDFPGGGRAAVEIGNLYRDKHRRLEVRCDEGTLVFDDVAADRLVRRTRDGGTEAIALPPATAGMTPLAIALRTFAEAIRGRSADLAPLRFAVDVVETLEACERALAAGGD